MVKKSMLIKGEDEPSMPRAPVVLFLGAGASAPIGFPTTKQFVKNIGLDPYDQNLLRTNMGEARAVFLNKMYQKIEIKDIEGVYNFVRSYHTRPEIELLMERVQESKNQECVRELKNHLNNIRVLERRINQRLHTSYDYQPEMHEKKALDIYAPLFQLLIRDNIMGDLSELPIFTTNYDVVLEKMLEHPFINDTHKFIDGFRTEERTGEMIYDDFEFTLVGKKETPVIKLYKLHGSMNWAIRKSDNVLVKKIGISVFNHPNYDSPFIAYPGDHNIPQRDEFKILNAHFEQALRKASICIVSGFSFRDDLGINLLFDQIMRNDNKKLFVEISNRRNKVQESSGVARVFNSFEGRYEYHSGGIQKLGTRLRSKYKNIPSKP